ncbi:MAG: thioredoxin domain-containing protein [Aestuariivirgaceae bacterium]
MNDPSRRNELDRESSPYLLQHRHNPVHWLPWGREAFDRARAEHKPVLLSIGYAACHWCHVMAHESFEDAETAELLNRDFIAIKVDREERPDVDRLYMDALHAFGEQGGWPLTMFLDSTGTPFWGGTYFPDRPRFGRPSFRQILTEIARIWRTEHDKVATNTVHIRQALQQQPPAQPPLPLSLERLDDAGQTLLKAVDFRNGGFRGAPKFPQVPVFEFLWRLYRRIGRQPYRDAVITTLTQLSQGGIYDHLGGGFARYSVDAEWLVPHFEKMLYDNAQLLRLLARVTISEESRLFRQRIEETADFLLTAMATDDGAFAASFDADSEGEEGKYYVWSESEIEEVLGPDAGFFKQIYAVTRDGNFEGRNILNRLGQSDLLDPSDEARLAVLRDRLLAIRRKRVPPGFDDKILADWNGLAIAALADAGLLLERPEWIAAAARAQSAVLARLWDGARLQQSWRGGQGRHAATADGYANLIDATLALYEATADAAHLATASALAEALVDHHWSEERSGFAFASDEADHLIARPCYSHDDATPNANATLMASLLKLGLATGNPAHGERAARLFDSFSGQALPNPYQHASFLNACDDVLHLCQIVVAGDAATAEARALRHAALRAAAPAKLLLYAAQGMAANRDHPAAGKLPVAGAPTLYLCQGTRCSLPITDSAAVSDALAGLDRSQAFIESKKS